MHSDILRDEPYRHLSMDLGRSWQANPSCSPLPPRSSLQAGRKQALWCAHTHTRTHGQPPWVVLCHHWPARSQPGCLLLMLVYEVRQAEICEWERSSVKLFYFPFSIFLIAGGRDVSSAFILPEQLPPVSGVPLLQHKLIDFAAPTPPGLCLLHHSQCSPSLRMVSITNGCLQHLCSTWDEVTAIWKSLSLAEDFLPPPPMVQAAIMGLAFAMEVPHTTLRPAADSRHRLPMEVVESPSPEVFMNRGDVALRAVDWWVWWGWVNSWTG